MGVFSPKPIDASDIRMLICLGTQYGTQTVFNNDASIVMDWTRGALDVSNNFKQALANFIQVEEEYSMQDTNLHVCRGRCDVLRSLKVLL
jgi:hypothetical protein